MLLIEDAKTAAGWLRDGKPIEWVAETLGCRADEVLARVPSGGATFTPTPAEIAAACAAIRQGWSEADHRERAGVSMAPLTIREQPSVAA